jgi:hypothetical protein
LTQINAAPQGKARLGQPLFGSAGGSTGGEAAEIVRPAVLSVDFHATIG